MFLSQVQVDAKWTIRQVAYTHRNNSLRNELAFSQHPMCQQCRKTEPLLKSELKSALNKHCQYWLP